LGQQEVVSDNEGKVKIQIQPVKVAGNNSFIAQLASDDKVFTYLCFKINSESWVMYLNFGLTGGLGMFLFGISYLFDFFARNAQSKAQSTQRISRKSNLKNIF